MTGAPTVKERFPVAPPIAPNLRTLAHQFDLAKQALHEVDHLYKAKYWTSCVSQAYQVVLRAAAGLLYGLGLNPLTEREVRIAYASAFVSSQRTTPRMDAIFRDLEKLRELTDFEYDHVSDQTEAEKAKGMAHEFYDEAQRLRVPVEEARNSGKKA